MVPSAHPTRQDSWSPDAQTAVIVPGTLADHSHEKSVLGVGKALFVDMDAHPGIASKQAMSDATKAHGSDRPLCECELPIGVPSAVSAGMEGKAGATYVAPAVGHGGGSARS
jgi:hypothetical protein